VEKWLPGLHGHPPEIETSSEAKEGGADQIMVPDGRPSDGDNNVGFGGSGLQGLLQLLGVIGPAFRRDHAGTVSKEKGGKHGGVALGNLIGRQGFAGAAQFGSVGNDGHAGIRVNGNLVNSGGKQDCEVMRPEFNPSGD
jgi:hypothetical protein